MQTALVRRVIADWLSRFSIPLDIGMALLACAYIVIGEFNDGLLGIHPTRLSDGVEVVITFVFVVEYVARLYAADDKLRFVRTHLLELLALVSTLRLLRVLRILRLLSVLRLARLAVFGRAYARLVRAFDSASEAFADPLMAYGIIGIVCLVCFGALALLQFEKGVNPDIKGFGDAFWMAFSVILTIGFASAKPITAEGRFITGVLIVGGLTCISFFTTALTIRLQRKSGDENERRLRHIEAMLEQLVDEESETNIIEEAS